MKTETQSKHAPGPWHLNQVGNHPFVSSPNGERIADCGPVDDNWNGWESESQAVENSALIASAPDLIRQRDELTKHLTAVLNRIDHQHQDGRNDWTEDDAEIYNQARAALANATESGVSL